VAILVVRDEHAQRRSQPSGPPHKVLAYQTPDLHDLEKAKADRLSYVILDEKILSLRRDHDRRSRSLVLRGRTITTGSYS